MAFDAVVRHVSGRPPHTGFHSRSTGDVGPSYGFSMPSIGIIRSCQKGFECRLAGIGYSYGQPPHDIASLLILMLRRSGTHHENRLDVLVQDMQGNK